MELVLASDPFTQESWYKSHSWISLSDPKFRMLKPGPSTVLDSRSQHLDYVRLEPFCWKDFVFLKGGTSIASNTRKVRNNQSCQLEHSFCKVTSEKKARKELQGHSRDSKDRPPEIPRNLDAVRHRSLAMPCGRQFHPATQPLSCRMPWLKVMTKVAALKQKPANCPRGHLWSFSSKNQHKTCWKSLKQPVVLWVVGLCRAGFGSLASGYPGQRFDAKSLEDMMIWAMICGVFIHRHIMDHYGTNDHRHRCLLS